MRKNSIKNEVVNSEVRRELSLIIGELKDPRVDPLTSVTEVSVTPDLKFCTVYISVLGDEENRKATMEGINNAKGYIRRELAQRVNLRNTPELTFKFDNSLEYGVRMSALIDEVIAKDEAGHAGESDEAGHAGKTGEAGHAGESSNVI